MIYGRILSFTYFLLFTLIMAGCAQSKKITFERDFNFEWKFSLMDSLDVAYQNNFDDSNKYYVLSYPENIYHRMSLNCLSRKDFIKKIRSLSGIIVELVPSISG